MPNDGEPSARSSGSMDRLNKSASTARKRTTSLLAKISHTTSEE
jgi:hypothetical protein